MLQKVPKGSFALFLSILVLLLIIGVTVVTSTFLYQRTSQILTDNLRQRLLAISITAASNIDAKDLSELRVEADWKKPEWGKVVKSLHSAKYSNDDIVYMYIFRYTPDPTDDPMEMEFVADADSIFPYANVGTDTSKYVDVNRDGKIEADGPDKLQWPGQPNNDTDVIPEAHEAFKGPTTVKELYSDDYGTVLTGYAPIKDETGKTVAVLATDIKANDFYTIAQQTLGPFIFFISFLSFIITVLLFILIFTWRKNDKLLRFVNSQIESQKITLNELLKAKEETLHIVNHQINTPIAVMRGAIDMLKDKIWTEEKVIGIFNEQLTRMKDTIAQFMAAKKAEDGNLFLAKSESDLGTIVKTLVDEKLLLKKVRESGMQIIFSDSNVYKLLLDTPKITEVVSNLLDNAINYSSNNIKLDISQNKKFVTLSVKDSGIGISKENISKLFSRFTRLDNAKKTRPDGTGLGLYVCKQIVEAHGGKIWVESEGEGKGSTFFISLPK